MIKINHLSFNYGPKKALFDDLSLHLPAGNIYGLLGKNGAGKSTLLKLISGLLFPLSGKMAVVGYAPMLRHPHFLQEVFLVTEEFDLPKLTMSRYIQLFGAFYPRFSLDLFSKYAGEFQLDTTQRLNNLSYGQKKKFLLAFGLATDCRLLIMDEPTNGLDIPSKSQFRRVIASAIHEERSFIISTHQVRDMESLIDPIIILDEGQIVFFQDCEHIARQLSFSRTAHLPGAEVLVHAESTLGGYTVVTRNLSGEETHINLEVLFNAVVGNKEKMHEIFQSQAS